VIPAAASEKVRRVVMANRAIRTVAGVPISAIPAYNIRRGPKEGGVLSHQGDAPTATSDTRRKQVFLAGDNRVRAAIKILKNIDVAFHSDESALYDAALRSRGVRETFNRRSFSLSLHGTEARRVAAALKGEPDRGPCTQLDPNAK